MVLWLCFSLVLTRADASEGSEFLPEQHAGEVGPLVDSGAWSNAAMLPGEDRMVQKEAPWILFMQSKFIFSALTPVCGPLIDVPRESRERLRHNSFIGLSPRVPDTSQLVRWARTHTKEA